MDIIFITNYINCNIYLAHPEICYVDILNDIKVTIIKLEWIKSIKWTFRKNKSNDAYV